MSYKYLEKYILGPFKSNGPHENSFYRSSREEVDSCEKKVGFVFPSSLKNFWTIIGGGLFRNTSAGYDEKARYYTPRLLYPEEVLSIVVKGENSGIIRPDAIEIWEELTPEFFPFFEIADSANFLMMKKNEPNNSAVYDMGGTLIEPKFEDFIHNLYYKSPVYYLDKLED